SDGLGSPAPRRMASKAKKPPLRTQDRLSDDEQSTPANTIETRPQAPLPSRARKTERLLKRQRTDQSDDEDHNAPVPAPSTSSRSQSMASAFATTSSHSSTRPAICTSTAA